MKQFDVITIGSAVRDLLFVTTDALIVKNPKRDLTNTTLIGFEYGAKIHSNDVHRFFGGGAMNTSIGMARLGLRVAACVRVGHDAEGVATIKHLKVSGVSTQYVQQDQQRNTGMSFLVIESKTNEHVAFVDYGANDNVTLPPQLLQQPPLWFYLSSLSTKQWPTLIKRLQTTTARLAWNPGSIQLQNDRQMLPLIKRTEVLILNRDEATELAVRAKRTKGDLLERIAALGATITIITNGRAGADAWMNGRRYHVQPSNQKPKDTTGAGDAFGSSVVAGLIRTRGNLLKALDIATINASAEVSKIGVQQGLLRWSDIQRKLKRTS